MYSFSWGLEFESPAWTWTWCSDNIEDLRGAFFYIGDPDVIMFCPIFLSDCVAVWHIIGRLTCFADPLHSIPAARCSYCTWGFACPSLKNIQNRKIKTTKIMIRDKRLYRHGSEKWPDKRTMLYAAPCFLIIQHSCVNLFWTCNVTYLTIDTTQLHP